MKALKYLFCDLIRLLLGLWSCTSVAKLMKGQNLYLIDILRQKDRNLSRVLKLLSKWKFHWLLVVLGCVITASLAISYSFILKTGAELSLNLFLGILFVSGFGYAVWWGEFRERLVLYDRHLTQLAEVLNQWIQSRNEKLSFRFMPMGPALFQNQACAMLVYIAEQTLKNRTDPTLVEWFDKMHEHMKQIGIPMLVGGLEAYQKHVESLLEAQIT